jgi:hypothetical protein
MGHIFQLSQLQDVSACSHAHRTQIKIVMLILTAHFLIAIISNSEYISPPLQMINDLKFFFVPHFQYACDASFSHKLWS